MPTRFPSRRQFSIWYGRWNLPNTLLTRRVTSPRLHARCGPVASCYWRRGQAHGSVLASAKWGGHFFVRNCGPPTNTSPRSNPPDCGCATAKTSPPESCSTWEICREARAACSLAVKFSTARGAGICGRYRYHPGRLPLRRLDLHSHRRDEGPGVAPASAGCPEGIRLSPAQGRSVSTLWLLRDGHRGRARSTTAAGTAALRRSRIY